MTLESREGDDLTSDIFILQLEERFGDGCQLLLASLVHQSTHYITDINRKTKIRI